MSVGAVRDRASRDPSDSPEDVARANGGSTPPKAPAARGKPAAVRVRPLPSTDALVAHAVATAARLQQSAAPPGLADLSLYTDDALDREIGRLRGRTDGRSGGTADAEREILGRLEAEQLRRATPVRVPPDTLTTRADLERVIATEERFLAVFGGRLADVVRQEHAGYVAGLRGKLELLVADERVCANARPTPTPANLLPQGAHAISFDADDLVAALKRQVPLTKSEEAQVRATFESWRRVECWRTGHDPTRFAPTGNYPEAQRDGAHEADAQVRMYLEMLDAMRSSTLAAAAFLDSAARGDTVEGAHARVLTAKNIGKLAGKLPTAPPVAPATQTPPPPRADVRAVDAAPKKLDAPPKPR